MSKLSDVADAIRALEGHPVPYGLAKRLSEVLKEIQVEIAQEEPPDPPGWEGGFAENH